MYDDSYIFQPRWFFSRAGYKETVVPVREGGV